MKNLIRALIGGSLLSTTLAAQEIGRPELVEIGPGSHHYRASGEFLKNGYPVDAPEVEARFPRALFIMKYQVSNRDYARCVADQVCSLPFKQLHVAQDTKPVTGVNFTDAQAYARWLSVKTGTVWRLPSDAEWAYSAGNRFFDDALGLKGGTKDPSTRWLLKYQQTIDRDRPVDPVVRPRGWFGANAHGVYDQSGNVWEWTSTCYRRSTMTNTGDVKSSNGGNCGVRVVEGRHRTYMTFFVRDAKSGGCAVGTPPDYLGFRLVRDNPAFISVRRARNWWTILTGS